jgi:hypothetical protein
VVRPKTKQFDTLSEGTEIMNLNNYKAILQNNTQIVNKFNIINYIKSLCIINIGKKNVVYRVLAVL